MVFRFIIILAIFLQPLLSIAQQTPAHADTVYRVRLKNNSLIKGKLVSKENNKLTLQSPAYGKVVIIQDSIRRMTSQVSVYKKGKEWYENPASSHYFISSTAIPMKTGEFSLQNSEIFFTKINYQATKNISFGTGVELLTPAIEGSFDNLEGPLVMADIKEASKITRWLHLGAQAFVARVPYTMNSTYYYYEDNNSYEAIFMGFGLATFGNSDNNLTAGVGYNYLNRFHASGPTYTLSGMVRVSPKLSLITENWLLPIVGGDYIFEPTGIDNGILQDTGDGYYELLPITYRRYFFITSYGIRIIGKRVAVDGGFANNQNIFQKSFIGYPYFGFSIKFL